MPLQSREKRAEEEEEEEEEEKEGIPTVFVL